MTHTPLRIGSCTLDVATLDDHVLEVSNTVYDEREPGVLVTVDRGQRYGLHAVTGDVDEHCEGSLTGVEQRFLLTADAAVELATLLLHSALQAREQAATRGHGVPEVPC